ncbi:hypothetical protein DDI_1783 [Dickeya dianthicola RNS04.9]|nr:hypothetical protein DDI_1783 [Dickeya dianthicola RNS04.9]
MRYSSGIANQNMPKHRRQPVVTAATRGYCACSINNPTLAF